MNIYKEKIHTMLVKFKEPLLRSGIILFISSVLGGGINYIFQIFMGRFLAVKNYAVFQALLSLLVIISVPKETLRSAMVKNISPLVAKKNFDGIRTTYYETLKKVGKVCILSMVVFVLFTPVVCNFLKIKSSFLILLVGVIFCMNIMLPVNLGMLQGLKKFFLFGIISLNGVALKLILGVLLVYLGFKVAGALVAVILSSMFIFAFTSLFIRKDFTNLPRVRKGLNISIIRSSLPMLLCFFLISVLMHVDIILVKHYFPERIAGLYSACSVLGRVALYFPGAIVIAMFSMVAHSHSQNEETIPILMKSLLYTFVSSGLIIVIYFLIPEFLLTFAFGERFAAIAYLLGLYGLATLPIALIRILANFRIAKGEYSFAYSLLAGVILIFTFVYFWHNSLKQILGIFFGVGVLLVVYNALDIFLERRKAEVVL